MDHEPRPLLRRVLAVVLAASPACFAGDATFLRTDTIAILRSGLPATEWLHADLDGDGYPETIGADGYARRVVIAKNNRGNASTVRNDTAGIESPRTFDAGDFDGDGDNDLLVGGIAGSSGSALELFQGQAPNLSIGDSVAIPSGLSTVYFARLADMDHDRDLDIVAIGRESGKTTSLLLWMEKDGGGWQRHALDSGTATYDGAEVAWLGVAQLNRDSISDVVAIYQPALGSQTHVRVWTSQPAGGRQVNTALVPQLVSDGAFADVDLDGDLDLFTGQHILFNSGLGTLSPVVFADGPTGIPDVVAAGDLNRDGWPDLAAVAYNEGVYLWQNQAGAGWTRTQEAVVANPKSVAIVDIDRDRFQDLVYLDQTRALFLYKINSANFCFQASAIHTGANIKSLALGDLEGDGDTDAVILATSTTGGRGGSFSVLKNEAGTLTKSAEVVFVSSVVIADIATGDIDGDGLMDFASGASGSLRWYRQLSGGAFAESLLYASASGFQDVTIADFDNDGDQDLAARLLGTTSRPLLVFFNDGEEHFTLDTLASDLDFYASFADLDKDGRLDLLTRSAEPTSPWVLVRRGAPGGQYPAYKVILPSDSLWPTSLRFADFDGDGDLDIGTATSKTGVLPVGWLENLGDTNTVKDGWPDWRRHIVRRDAGYGDLELADFDRNGRVDYLVEYDASPNLYWLSQDSLGLFSGYHRITSTTLAASARVVDFDRDGWPDVVAISKAGDKVQWYRNLLGQKPARAPEIPVSVGKPTARPVGTRPAVRCSVDGPGPHGCMLVVPGPGGRSRVIDVRGGR